MIGWDPFHVKYELVGTKFNPLYRCKCQSLKEASFNPNWYEAVCRGANEEEEDPHPRGFWLILLPHSPGNEIFDSSYSLFLEE